jgi:hypothetical protein
MDYYFMYNRLAFMEHYHMRFCLLDAQGQVRRLCAEQERHGSDKRSSL